MSKAILKKAVNEKLKEMGLGSLRINSKIYRTRLNKMVKGIGLYAVGPYTVNEMQYTRFKELVERTRENVKGYIVDSLSGYARIEVGSVEIVMTLQSVQVGEYTHYYAAYGVK